MKNKTIFKINIIYFVALVGVAILFALGYLGIIKNDILASCLLQIDVMFAIPLLLYTLMVQNPLFLLLALKLFLLLPNIARLHIPQYMLISFFNTL